MSHVNDFSLATLSYSTWWHITISDLTYPLKKTDLFQTWTNRLLCLDVWLYPWNMFLWWCAFKHEQRFSPNFHKIWKWTWNLFGQSQSQWASRLLLLLSQVCYSWWVNAVHPIQISLHIIKRILKIIFPSQSTQPCANRKFRSLQNISGASQQNSVAPCS